MQVLCFHGHACNLPLRSQCCGLFGISWGGEALWEPKLSSKLPGDSRSVLYHKAWPTLHGSTPIKDCNAGERRAGINPPPPEPAAGQWGGRDPLPRRKGGETGICSGLFNFKPSSFPTQTHAAAPGKLLGSAAAVRTDGFEILHIIYTVQVPEYHWVPQCFPPGQQDFSWES